MKYWPNIKEEGSMLHMCQHERTERPAKLQETVRAEANLGGVRPWREEVGVTRSCF